MLLLIAVVEILMLYFVRDNLTLNILMLLIPPRRSNSGNSAGRVVFSPRSPRVATRMIRFTAACRRRALPPIHRRLADPRDARSQDKRCCQRRNQRCPPFRSQVPKSSGLTPAKPRGRVRFRSISLVTDRRSRLEALERAQAAVAKADRGHMFKILVPRPIAVRIGHRRDE